MEERNNEKKPQQKGNKVVAFLRRVFVHNIGWKLLALVSSFIIWALVAGFAGLVV